MTLPPLEAVKKMSAAHPKLWDTIDYLIAIPDSEVSWDRATCYCPIAAALAALSQDTDRLSASDIASFAAALAAWRRGKYIYRFDETLAEEICNTAEDMVMPIEVLHQMPSQCVYIEIEDCEKAAPDQPTGFFAHIEHDTNTKQKELRIAHITRNGDLYMPNIVHLIPGGTIGDGVTAALRQSRADFSGFAQYIRLCREMTIRSVQLLLYICAENAEIVENESQAKIYRKSPRVTDKLREVRKYDVGKKTGVILRQNRQKSPSPSTKSAGERAAGYKMRSHLRRAHWHHFWTGSGENKKLILRWISSTVINPSEDEETPATIIKIEKNDKK